VQYGAVREFNVDWKPECG